MVIIGHYETERIRVPRPRVWGYVGFPRLGAQGLVEFLVDSGADSVILHSADVINIGIPRDMLQEDSLRESVGIGGTQRYYSEAGVLSFDVESSIVQCDIDIRIAVYGTAVSTRIPSLLGRDFPNLCDVRLNHSAGVVSLIPLNVDGNGFIQPP